MSYPKTYGRDTSTHSSTNLQKEREREKKRREQQLSTPEENVDELFSQPRKVSTSRQDSLTRNLNNVLGDASLLAEHLFRGEPSLWLGTSRSGNQGPPTPAPAPPSQDASPRTYQNSNQHKSSSSSNRSYTSSQKRELSNSSQSSRPGSSMSSSTSAHRSSSYHKLRDERSHQNNSQIKSNQLSFNLGHGSTQMNPVHARNSKERQDSQIQSTKTGTTFNSSHLPMGQKNSNSSSIDATDSLHSLKVDIPSRISDRDRVSSVDSDMLGGVENIFEDMIPLERPIGKLADAKTPGTGETKFNFNTKITKKKPVGPESSVESSIADGVEANASDSESSDDDSSDDEEQEEEESNSSVWNLGNYYNNNSEKSQFSVNEKGKNDKKSTEDRGSSKTENTPRPQSIGQGNSVTKSSPKNQSSNYSVAHDSAVSRGRRADKKQASRNPQTHPRSSSSSSQRSASSSQRSTSSGRRSASSHHRTTSNQIRDMQTNLNQTEPVGRWSSGKSGDSQRKKSDKAETQHKDLSSSREGEDRPVPNSPKKSNSNYNSPRSATQVKSESSIKKNHPSTVRKSPAAQPSTNAFKQSGVKKETLSTTKTAVEVKPRHSVGRKGPSGRIAVKGAVDQRSGPKDIMRQPKTVATGLSDDSSSDSSDDENDVTVRNPTPIQQAPVKQPIVGSDSDSNSSSDSDSDSSSSSDLESENEVVKDRHNDSGKPAPVSWALEDLTPKQEYIPKKSPSFKNEIRVSPPPVPNKCSCSPKPDQKTYNPNTVKDQEKAWPKQKDKKSSRKSAPGSLTPNTPVSDAEDIAGKTHKKNSSSSHQSSSSNTWSKNRSQSSTVDSSYLSQKSKSRTMSSSSDKAGRKHANPRAAGHSGQETKSFSAKNKFDEKVQNEYDSYAPLLVRITSSVLKREASSSNINLSTDYGRQTQASGRSSSNTDRPRSLDSPSKRSKSTFPSKAYTQRCLTTVSTGSETDQPIRRADSVQVAVADGSTDWPANGSGSTTKRKMNLNNQSYDDNQSQAGSSKRRKRDKSSSRQSSPGSNHSPWTAENSHNKKTSPSDHWREESTRETSEQSSNNHQLNRHPNHPSSREPYHSNRTPNSRNQTRQESPSSNNAQYQHGRHPATNGIDIVLPDSSVPEQERIQTSDWYMREGKRMKHEGDGLADTSTGRTKMGEALNRALAYFEAALYFIMSGYVMEVENNTERMETSSNSGSSSTSHSPANMYQQTIQLLDYILKMRPHVEQEDSVFKRIMISCIRCQSILYYRVFKLNKERAIKYSEILTDQFKSKSNCTINPSPRHHPANVAPNVVSPMSPAVPSPLCHPGPSPVNSINGAEQVSSSTQPGKMTPPSHGSLIFPQKTYDTYRQHHTIMCNLLLAHEKWDQGEIMLEGHTDFFQNIDALCNRTITFHTSLRDVFLYHKVVLHQLRALTTNSPRE